MMKSAAMSTQIHLPLVSFADRVRSDDEHAAHHLPLLERAARVLAGEVPVSPEARRDLAARLERWRYQYLNRRSGRVTPDDRGFIDALDLAANELARRPSRAPRSPRTAMQGPSVDDPALVEAEEWLDPGVPLESITRRAAALTEEHFGAGSAAGAAAQRRWRILLYAPLYLSNYCTNHCRYCGFRYPHAIRRRHLSVEEALREAEILRGRGFRHLLLVAGDYPRLTTPAYFAEILRALGKRGIVPAVEIAPQSTEAYETLLAAGAAGVTLYQETYVEELYAQYHPRGSKAALDWRLEAPERAAEAGMKRLGLGILLGLGDPCADLPALMRHGRYLAGRFPDRTLAFSLPRIYEAPEGFHVRYPVDDETFLRMYCTLRIAFPRAELVLSTREPEALRNRLATICITQMSAGSSTAPGGYEDAGDGCRAGEQFPVCDQRSPAEVAAWLRGAGFEAAWELPP